MKEHADPPEDAPDTGVEEFAPRSADELYPVYFQEKIEPLAERFMQAACFHLDGAGPGHAVRSYLAPARRLGRESMYELF